MKEFYVAAVVAPPDGRDMESVAADLYVVQGGNNYEACKAACDAWVADQLEMGCRIGEWTWDTGDQARHIQNLPPIDRTDEDIVVFYPTLPGETEPRWEEGIVISCIKPREMNAT